MSEELPAVERTTESRYRKMALCVLALTAVHVTQSLAGKPMTWPVMAADAVIVVSFVAGNVLARLADSAAAQKVLGRLQQVAGGGR